MVGMLVAGPGLITPALVLGLLIDGLPRVTVQERVAWDAPHVW